MSADSEGSLRGGERKVQERDDGTRYVTLPADMCDEVGIEGGDYIDFEYPGELPFEGNVVKRDG